VIWDGSPAHNPQICLNKTKNDIVNPDLNMIQIIKHLVLSVTCELTLTPSHQFCVYWTSCWGEAEWVIKILSPPSLSWGGNKIKVILMIFVYNLLTMVQSQTFRWSARYFCLTGNLLAISIYISLDVVLLFSFLICWILLKIKNTTIKCHKH